MLNVAWLFRMLSVQFCYVLSFCLNKTTCLAIRIYMPPPFLKSASSILHAALKAFCPNPTYVEGGNNKGHKNKCTHRELWHIKAKLDKTLEKYSNIEIKLKNYHWRLFQRRDIKLLKTDKRGGIIVMDSSKHHEK